MGIPEPKNVNFLVVTIASWVGLRPIFPQKHIYIYISSPPKTIANIRQTPEVQANPPTSWICFVFVVAMRDMELEESLVRYGCFQNNGIPKSSILIGFSLINHPFWWFSPYFWFNTHIISVNYKKSFNRFWRLFWTQWNTYSTTFYNYPCFAKNHSCLESLAISELHQLVVSTHLKNISQIGSFPQIGMKIKNIWNHHPVHCILLATQR